MMWAIRWRNSCAIANENVESCRYIKWWLSFLVFLTVSAVVVQVEVAVVVSVVVAD